MRKRLRGCRWPAAVSAVLGCGFALATWSYAYQETVQPYGFFTDSTFDLYHAFYGNQAYTDPAASANFRSRMATGFSFSAPVDTGLVEFVRGGDAGLMLDLAGASYVQDKSATYIESQRQALAALGLTGGHKPIWVLMTEWDQGGGPWVPQGRPHYDSLTREQAYGRFRDYYLSAPPLKQYLAEPRKSRAVSLAAVTTSSPNTFHAYDWGVDLSFLERGIDELGDISTGVAFQRGAASQYDRKWGIDLSTWRTSNERTTQFNSNGVLIGGWSPSYLRRHLYVSYLSGAHGIHIEPTTYYYPDGRLNPFGEIVREFSDFALVRHPNIGRPVVSTALLVDHYNGFDPKHGQFNQSDAVWYQDIPYSDGDFMINNFLKVAYPNHWLHGLAPGAPFADAGGRPSKVAFQDFLARGGDPRPYEPMPNTRWGDHFDFITAKAPFDVMRRYKVIVLLGAVPLDASLRESLRAWVEQGGKLVVNASQVSTVDEGLLGVRLDSVVRTDTNSIWLADGTEFNGPQFRYTVVRPDTATTLARTHAGDPIITSNRIGGGEVILTTPAFLQTVARDTLVAVGSKLFDALVRDAAPAQISGAPVQYILNRARGRLSVTIVNHSAQTWQGEISTKALRDIRAVKEYILDKTVDYSITQSTLKIAAQVPPYDLRVYAIEYSKVTP